MPYEAGAWSLVAAIVKIPFPTRPRNPAAASAAAAMFLLLVVKAVAGLPGEYAALPRGFGTAEYVGHMLFGEFFYPFEAISLVLLAAMAGAIVLAKRRL